MASNNEKSATLTKEEWDIILNRATVSVGMLMDGFARKEANDAIKKLREQLEK